MHEYVSAIHVHTLYSDGHSDVEEIAGEGGNAGVDVVMITDHGNDAVRRQGKEGWYGDVLILTGYELNDRENKNHFLVFDLDECIDGTLGADVYMKEVHEKGGIGILAHPDERRVTFPQYPSYEWTEWPLDGFTGIEIWNFMSEWMEGLKPGRRLFTLVFPDVSIRGPTRRILAHWDTIAARRRVVAIGSADAHCHQHRIFGLTVSIFPYEKLFRRIRTHIMTEKPLTGDATVDRGAVFEALRAARVFISNRKYGDARGFSFTSEGKSGVSWMGDEKSLSEEPVLKIMVPGKGSVRLLRNGEEVRRTRKSRFTFRPRSPGAYRIEVRRWGKPWIFSNHIRITS